MYRIKCKDRGNKWRLGIVVYSTLADAHAREIELNAVGIKTKIVKA